MISRVPSVAKVLLPLISFKPSLLENGGNTTKMHTINSIDKTNVYRIHSVLFCYVSFRLQVIEVCE